MGSVDFKLVLIGSQAVGKTSLFNRYVYNEFPNTQMTVGAYFAIKQCKVKDQIYNVSIWDTAGEEKFESLTTYYCRGAHAAVICYDISDFSSFTALAKWIDKIKNEAADTCELTIVGNKLDLLAEDPQQRKVPYDEAKECAMKESAELFEVSAKNGENVDSMFNELITRCVQSSSAQQLSRNELVSLNNDQGPTSNCCN